MSKNIKEIGKELLGKSLNSFHIKTGLTQLEKNNEMQDGILDGILSQVDDAYIEKTEQSNVIHLDGSGDGVVVLDSIEGNTMSDSILDINMYNKKNKSFSISTRWETVKISCRAGKLNDKIYYRIKLKLNKLETEDTRLAITSMRDEGGFNNNFAFLKDIGIGNTKEISIIRDIDANCNNLYNSISIGCQGEVPNDCTSGVEFANFTLEDFVVVNLTELFGSGNEPSQEWCDINIPYIEGLKSSFEEKVNDEGKYEIEILMKNKNLYTYGDLKNWSYNNSTNNAILECVRVEPNTTYTLSKKGEGLLHAIEYTTPKYNYIGDTQYNHNYVYTNRDGREYRVNNSTGKITFTTGNNINYLWITGSNGTTSTEVVNQTEIQLEKANDKTNYIPHKQNKIKLLLNEPLRGIDKFKDRLCIKDNKLVIERNNYSQEITPNIGYIPFIKNNSIVFAIKPKMIPKGEYGVCNIFATDNNGWGYIQSEESDDREFCQFYSNFMYIHIKKSRLSSPDAQGINEWLSVNKVVLVYPLEEPYYEEVLNEYGEPVILEGYENGTLYIDSTVIPTTTVRYTPKMESFKTLKEVNKNNNLITLDINENIIPYMMDVDYMIMEKELCLLNTKNIRKMEELDMTSMQKRTQDMLERLIKGKTLTEQECKTRVTTYLNAGKITDEQAEELMLVISEVYA